MFSRSRRNLARWFTLSMGSILMAFAGVLFYLEATDELEELDHLLYKKSQVMAASIQYEFDGNQWQVDLAKVPLLGVTPPPLASELIYARWYDAQGQLVQFFGPPPPSPPTLVVGFETLQLSDSAAAPTASRLRQVTLPVQENNRVIGYLQVATPLASTQNSLDQLRLSLAVAVPITLASIALTGWFLGGLAMQPIHQAYEQLQRFTANASHELRAPLAAILSNAQVGLLAEEASQRQLRLQRVVDLTKSMSALIGQLLFLARQTGPLPAIALQPIDLAAWLPDVVDRYWSEAAAHRLSLRTVLTEQSLKVRADPELLRQAIANLLSNACKYTPADGKVQVRLLRQERRAVIQVADNGPGIPAKDLPHIFEQFYRVDTERQRQTGGFGLGLAIAQQIVEAHGGHLRVSSSEGTGATFQIELPLG